MKVARNGDLPLIWEAFACVKGGMEELSTLNQALLQGLKSCSQVFRERAHFRTSLPLLVFVKNVSLFNPFLDPACTGVVHTLDDAPRIGQVIHSWGC